MVRLPDDMAVRDGHLVFDGVDVVDLARQVETPFFLYSAARVRANIEALVAAFRARHAATEVFYASKACSNLWFLGQVRRAGIAIEVNSGGELWKALRVGFPARKVLFNGVAKSVAEVRTAIDDGVRALVVDSRFELERIAEVARDRGKPARVALRVDVDVPTLTHPGLMTTHGGKAGIDLDEAVDAFAFARAHAFLQPRGLHLHIGSQITSVEPYVRAVEVGLDLIAQVEAATGLRLEHLNAGGGFAVPYRDTPACEPVDYFCSTLTADDYAAAICGVVERRRPGLKLFLEPGRSIAGDTAVLVTTIENAKRKAVRDATGRPVDEERWLMVDAGFNTLLEHTNYHWYFRTMVASRADEPADTPFRLAGPLCDGGDVFAGDDETPYRLLPAACRPGDIVAFFDAGAYTLEMMNPYNARPRAAAYAVQGGKVGLIRTPESYDELVASDVQPSLGGR